MSKQTNFEKLLEDLELLSSFKGEELIECINKLRLKIKDYSPFNKEPVDCVVWVKQDRVVANEYNPNSVAPPEMKLLETSIEQDGYTQPIVSWFRDDQYEVVDGFHRNRVGKESKKIKKRIKGYLPLTIINNETSDLNARMASTIRHNRARGKHSVDSMSDIVVELKKRNWTDSKIAKNLGMQEDEILRLTQISGLTEMFNDIDFSESWDVGIFDNDEDLGEF
jgi:ParB-like chromosome segregation protein Spo0J